MAVGLVKGLQGSGKSYLGVSIIESSIKKDFIYKKEINNLFPISQKQYIYHNLSSYSEESELEDVKVYRFNKNIFLKVLSNLRRIFEEDDEDSEEKLIVYAKKNKLFNSLLVLDEAHSLFKKKFVSEDLMFLITYHRHWNMDLFLITQDVSLINRDYLLCEKYIACQQATNKVSDNHFKYGIFNDSYFSKTNLLDTIKLKKDPNIFEKYSGGGQVETMNFLKSNLKKFILPIFAVLFSVISLYFIFFTDDDVVEDFSNKKKSFVPVVKKSSSFNNDNEKYIVRFACLKHSSTCRVMPFSSKKISYFTTDILSYSRKKVFSSKNLNNNYYVFSNYDILTLELSEGNLKKDFLSVFSNKLYKEDVVVVSEDKKEKKDDSRSNNRSFLQDFQNSIRL